MRITMVSPSLSAGGAERCVVLLSHGFQENGHQVSIITIAGTSSDFYSLPNITQRLALDLASSSPTSLHGIRNNLRRLRRLRAAVISTNPDIVISHIIETNILTSLAVINTGYPVVAVEHIDLSNNPRRRIWGLLRRLTYPRLAQVVTVSQGIHRDLDWVTESQKTVIRNPVQIIDDGSEPFRLDASKKWIAAMGSLIPRKGHDLLLHAFSRVSSRHSEWHLVIMGEGELRDELEQLADLLGLNDRVCFAGLVHNPFPVLRTCDLFVMSSHSEGFPYALLEAMACGLPPISTDCPTGPAEIIRNEIDGLLVPNGDTEALATAMGRLMSNEPERHRLANRAKEVSERFSLEKVAAQWEELFSRALARSAALPSTDQKGHVH